MSILPEYYFIKRQKNKIKGHEVHHQPKEGGWPVSLGFFRTMKECRECVSKHKKGKYDADNADDPDYGSPNDPD